MRLELDLPPDAESPQRARAAVDSLPIAQTPMQDARLLVTELVTNSVLHAGLESCDAIVLRAECADGCLRIEVWDTGHGFVERRGDPGDNGGRGLELVKLLARRWGIWRNGVTCVWFEIGCADLSVGEIICGAPAGPSRIQRTPAHSRLYEGIALHHERAVRFHEELAQKLVARGQHGLARQKLALAAAERERAARARERTVTAWGSASS